MEAESYPVIHRVERIHWFFVARRRIVATLLDQFFPKKHNARVLDAGGGTGGLVDVLAPFGSLIGMDYSEEALAYYHQHHPVVCRGDATHLPFESDSFEFVIALDLLEHLEDDLAGLSEFHRVLKPGGRALFSVPAFQFLWGELDDMAHHYRRYRRVEFCAKARRAGFQVLKGSYLNTFLFPLVACARRTESFRAGWTKPDADLKIPPAPINAFLANVFGAEAWLLPKLNLPFGVSVLCVVEK